MSRFTETDRFKDTPLFQSDSYVDYLEPVKNESFGDSYFISSLSLLSDNNPELVKDLFLTGTKNNAAGLYAVTFYIRGKPWIVTVDDFLLFDNSTGNEDLLYARNKDDSAMWVPILEKAWAKVKGSYEQINGGFM